MTLLVRNEADIIEANLDYHLAQGVDFVIVTDHGSTDGTAAILDRYERDRPVVVLHEEGEEHHQSRRVTRMARLALTEHGADWVIHNDADEFWWPLSGSLHDVFAAIPSEYGQVEVQRRNFLPRPEAKEPFYSRLVYRDAQSLSAIGLPLEPKVAHRAHPDVVVAPGNHWISGAELRPAPIGDLLEIFHFPMRSYEQFERKVIQVGIGYEKLDQRSPEVGRDQMRLLQVYREKGLGRYYEDAVLNEAALAQGIEGGRVVLDRRLEGFMRTLSEDGAHPTRPDGPPTRSFISRSLKTSLELDASRQALTQTKAELAAAMNELSWLRTELANTSDTLQSVRNSRLMRWTAPVRRLWYRVSAGRSSTA